MRQQGPDERRQQLPSGAAAAPPTCPQPHIPQQAQRATTTTTTFESALWVKSRAASVIQGGQSGSLCWMEAPVSSRVSRSKGGRPTSSS